jgi:hypothetical protein
LIPLLEGIHGGEVAEGALWNVVIVEADIAGEGVF